MEIREFKLSLNYQIDEPENMARALSSKATKEIFVQISPVKKENWRNIKI